MLAVYQDKKCHVIRLHAAVRSGELKKCPVWSAFGMSSSRNFSTEVIFDNFSLNELLSPEMPSLSWPRLIETTVSHESESPEWIYRRSAHRMWLKKLQPFVFCENYKKRRQIQKRGEYEIYFVNKKGLWSLFSLGMHYLDWRLFGVRFGVEPSS